MHVVGIDLHSVHLYPFRSCVCSEDLLFHSDLAVYDIECHGQPQPEAVEVDSHIGVDVAEPDGHDAGELVDALLQGRISVDGDRLDLGLHCD